MLAATAPDADRRPTTYRPSGTVRLSAALVVLVAVLVALPPGMARAVGDLVNEIAAARRTLHGLEASMRAQDRHVGAFKHDRRVARAHAHETKKHMKAVRHKRNDYARRVAELKGLLAQAIKDADNAAEGDPKPAAKVARLQTTLDKRSRTHHYLARKVRAFERQIRAQDQRARIATRRLKGAVRSQAAASGALYVAIKASTQLAQQRAVTNTSWRPAADGGGFAWPMAASISQGYGCTGFQLEPRRGSCRHFHDGIDLRAADHAPIGAAADGVVAYVGWGYGESADRAFIVVLGHAGGYESLYAHLLPIRRVSVGEVVHQGRTIGFAGNTGNSTGTHLHWEVSRDWQTVDPRSVLQAGAPGGREQGHQAKQEHHRHGHKHGAHRHRHPGAQHRKAQAHAHPKHAHPKHDHRHASGKHRHDAAKARPAKEPETTTPDVPVTTGVVPPAADSSPTWVPPLGGPGADDQTDEGPPPGWWLLHQQPPVTADPTDEPGQASADDDPTEPSQ